MAILLIEFCVVDSVYESHGDAEFFHPLLSVQCFELLMCVDLSPMKSRPSCKIFVIEQSGLIVVFHLYCAIFYIDGSIFLDDVCLGFHVKWKAGDMTLGASIQHMYDCQYFPPVSYLLDLDFGSSCFA